MAQDIQIACGADIANLFSRGQHNLDPTFKAINGLEGTWQARTPDAGRFPYHSGFAARTTTIGQQRLNFGQLNLWKQMVGLQSDCAVSCNPPETLLEFANADHKWYYLFNASYYTRPFCLESMFADSLSTESLTDQIQQIFRDLKYVTSDVFDEFGRRNHNAVAANKWLGWDDGTNQDLFNNRWSFATDANGNADPTYIVLDTIDPNFISTLSVTGILNYIRDDGHRIGTFPVTEDVKVVTDFNTFSDLPLYDSNRRWDTRYREPSKTDPSYAAIRNYAGYQLDQDFFAMRYNWTTSDPAYPGGVLKRVEHWANQAFSEGCLSNTNPAYLKADFQLSDLWGGSTVAMQSGEQPTSAGSGVTFGATTSPYNGMWHWMNDVNEYTPKNARRNLGFWLADFKKAAKPLESGIRGHAILHRRFPVLQNISRVCATLRTTDEGSADCTLTCPPLDLFPPAMVERWTCGCWNDLAECDPNV